MMIIKWVSKFTGYTSHGEPLQDDIAIKWCAKMDAEYPMIEHTTIQFNGDSDEN